MMMVTKETILISIGINSALLVIMTTITVDHIGLIIYSNNIVTVDHIVIIFIQYVRIDKLLVL